MQIVTDSAADLAPGQLEGVPVHYAALQITLGDKTYTSGIDLQPDEFYRLLEETGGFPTTSQPSAGDFAALYRELAQRDPEILSIHISSGLSGTLSAAQAGAAMVPEANITFFDTQTLSCPQGWMVQFAAKAAQQGWSIENIIERMNQMRQRTQGLFTLSSLKYLIHGGRISHIKALAASVLNIKPIIGPGKEDGKYITFGQERSLGRAIRHIPDVVAKIFPDLSQLRVQLLHGDNPKAVEMLKDAISQRFNCHFEPTAVIAPVLGAHTGPSVVGLAVGDLKVFEGLE